MFDVNMLLTSFGLIGILGIIFMETGLLIGFIFPGDTLLFTPTHRSRLYGHCS